MTDKCPYCNSKLSSKGHKVSEVTMFTNNIITCPNIPKNEIWLFPDTKDFVRGPHVIINIKHDL